MFLDLLKNYAQYTIHVNSLLEWPRMQKRDCHLSACQAIIGMYSLPLRNKFTLLQVVEE